MELIQCSELSSLLTALNKFQEHITHEKAIPGPLPGSAVTSQLFLPVFPMGGTGGRRQQYHGGMAPLKHAKIGSQSSRKFTGFGWEIIGP